MNILRANSIIRKATYILKRLLRNIRADGSLLVFGSQQNNIEAVYVINLDRQPARWKSFVGEAQRQLVNERHNLLDFCHRLPAIDGKNLNSREVSSKIDPSYPIESQYYVDPDPTLLSIIREKSINVEMTKEEIAVALSHISAWQKIVADKVSYALILEDDIFFEQSFANQLNQVWLELPDARNDGYRFDLLYLSYREVDHGAQKVSISPHLNQPIRGYWWLSGYVLSYVGAKKLLDLLPVNGPVDLWMNLHFSELDVYTSSSSIISQRTDIPSNNQYSILPFLSKIGVQSDMTHLILERSKGKSPVFCIGFDHSSADQLETALSLLGYRCYNDKWGKLTNTVNGILETNLPLLFDAYIRTRSISKAVKQLEKLYLNAVIILPHSPINGSEISIKEHKEITDHFAGKDNRLLMIKIRDKNTFHVLARFLQCKPPKRSFPECRGVHIQTTMPIKIASINMWPIEVLEHDVHPWIVPYERLSAFGIFPLRNKHGIQFGTFTKVVDEKFNTFDASHWKVVEGSFPSNLAQFKKENVSISPCHGCNLALSKKRSGNKEYSAGSIESKNSYQFGRFEITLKPAKGDGIVTAFFLHRNDPWQEIDLEFLGCDTTRIMTNVYFNPGNEGTNFNFGNRGTPIMIDLPFDAADEFHQYTIEWEPHELRRFVDNELVHVRSTWEPTPIPDQPMEIYCNIWPPRSAALSGLLHDSDLPICSYVKYLSFSKWSATNYGESKAKEVMHQ